MLTIFLLKTLFNHYADYYGQQCFEKLGLVAENFEFFLFEKKEAIGGADFFGFGVNSGNF